MNRFTKFLCTVSILAVTALAATAQTATNATPALTPEQIASVDNSIQSLIPLVPAAEQHLIVSAILIMSLLGHVGRVIQGYRTGGIPGAISGLFAGTNSPSQTGSYPPPPANPRGSSGSSPFPVIIAALLLIPAAGRSQTNASSVTLTNYLGSNPATLALQDIGNLVTPLAPYLTNNTATLSLGGGENLSSHSPVAVAMLTLPVSANASLGILGGYQNGTWYEGGAALQWGVTNNVPVIGNVRSFAGEGVVYDIANRAPANYSYGGFEKGWTISTNWTISASIVTANTSDTAGVNLLGILSINATW